MILPDPSRQAGYYEKTAADYDSTHLAERDEHYTALQYMIGFLRQEKLHRILDVGCGTGRATLELYRQGFDVIGIDPVPALLAEAEKKGLPSDRLILGNGQQLPFPDGNFDAVCEFGVLHHVPKPVEVVEEMLRVTSKGIFLSDTNRFGRSRMPVRLAKLVIWKAGLWQPLYWIAKGGKSYDCSECDGIAYSYSIYDSFDQIDAWADRTFVIPTKVEGKRQRSWLHPLLTSSHGLLCGIKNKPQTY